MEPGPLDFWTGGALMAFGMLGYYIKKMWELEQAGQHLSPLAYLKQKPWGTAAMIFGAVSTMMLSYFMGQLNELSAILIGGGSTSVNDAFRARAESKITKE